jgi:hypothetical protein
MAEDLNFIPSGASFDPATVNLLSDAFEHAWHKVQTSRDRLARPACAYVMREVMAKYIVNLAQRGEREDHSIFSLRTTRIRLPQLAALSRPVVYFEFECVPF